MKNLPILPPDTPAQIEFLGTPQARTRNIKEWNKLVRLWDGCFDCTLCESRHKIVHFRGSIPCDILFIGEAPGDSEDTIGYPFIGRAGKIFNKLLLAARERTLWKHWTYGITNVVACRPPRDS